MSTQMIPAIDVRNGQVVRLTQGDYAQQTTYPMDPLELAIAYAEQGAQILHFVDLDAARLGGFSLHKLVRAIRCNTALRIQAGGGIRSREQILTLREAGADCVVIGTLALTEKDLVRSWLKEFGSEAITLAFDVRRDDSAQWRCASHGWTELSSESLHDIIDAYQRHGGLQHVLCTDIQRDGLLSGYNLDLYRELGETFPALRLQASGGVSTLEDIRNAKALGVSGAILGRALLENKFSLAEAIAC